MPFHFGQVFECQEEGRTREAIVLHTGRDGAEGLLRYVDTRIEEWVHWDEFEKTGKWRRTGGER